MKTQQRIPPGSRVSYKSLSSEKVYYGKVIAINDQWARVEDSQGTRTVSTSRLKFIPQVFAGRSG
jgi:hypothetical protein